MKLWHKRVMVGSFFDLDRQSQAIEKSDDCSAEDNVYLIAEDGEYWDLGLFMRVTNSRYDGVMTVSNTGAIGIVISENFEDAVIQCFS